MPRIAAACPASPNPRRKKTPAWHRVFLGMLPQITTYAKFAFRHFKPEARAEAVQEVVCNALKAFVRLVQLKKTNIAYPTVLASYGVRQTRDGRKVGGHLNVEDVLSKYCQEHKDVVVQRLDRRDKDDENTWCEVLVEDRRCGPAQIACTRIDFSDWLASLPCRHRRLAQYLSLGNRTADAAKKFKVSAGRISQLRKELAASWNKFVGDDPARLPWSPEKCRETPSSASHSVQTATSRWRSGAGAKCRHSICGRWWRRFLVEPSRPGIRPPAQH